jgi:hypothetical protein
MLLCECHSSKRSRKGCVLILSAAARYSATPLWLVIESIGKESGVAEYLAAALQIKTPLEKTIVCISFCDILRWKQPRNFRLLPCLPLSRSSQKGK